MENNVTGLNADLKQIENLKELAQELLDEYGKLNLPFAITTIEDLKNLAAMGVVFVEYKIKGNPITYISGEVVTRNSHMEKSWLSSDYRHIHTLAKQCSLFLPYFQNFELENGRVLFKDNQREKIMAVYALLNGRKDPV